MEARRLSVFPDPRPRLKRKGVKTRSTRILEIRCAMYAHLKSRAAEVDSKMSGRRFGMRAVISAGGVAGGSLKYVDARSRICFESCKNASQLERVSYSSRKAPNEGKG
jgi:hypothetical protein